MEKGRTRFRRGKAVPVKAAGIVVIVLLVAVDRR
jgi:hypothetical protein